MAVLKEWITPFLAICILLALALSPVRGGQAVAALQPPTLHNPHDVDRLPNGHTLITDGGYPAGGTQSSGSDSRVLEVDAAGNIIWSFANGLDFAHSAQRLPNGNVLISDTGNDRVIEANPAGDITWNSDNVVLSDGSTLIGVTQLRYRSKADEPDKPVPPPE